MPATARAQLNGMVVAGRVALVVGHPSPLGLTQVRCMVRMEAVPEEEEVDQRAVADMAVLDRLVVHLGVVPWKQAS